MSKKDAYVKMIKAQLDEWSADIDKLQAKAQKAEADLQLEYQEQIDKARSLRESVQHQLSELQDAGEQAWREFKSSVESARDELQSALNKASKDIQ